MRTKLIIAAAFLMSALLSTTAQAQTPTPYPTQPGPEPTPVSAPHFTSFPSPLIVPTFEVALGVPNRWASSPNSEVRQHPLSTQVPIWGGVAFHPMPGVISPWSAVGVEGNIRDTPDGLHSEVEWIPEVRFGASILTTQKPKWSDAILPPGEIYGIAGWRFANRDRESAVRLGLGVSSPIVIMALAAAGRDSCVPLPTMFETVWDLEPNHQHEFQFRFGWQF